jgi:hypothetical protein
MQKMRNAQEFSQEKGQFENITSVCEDDIKQILEKHVGMF